MKWLIVESDDNTWKCVLLFPAIWLLRLQRNNWEFNVKIFPLASSIHCFNCELVIWWYSVWNANYCLLSNLRAQWAVSMLVFSCYLIGDLNVLISISAGLQLVQIDLKRDLNWSSWEHWANILPSLAFVTSCGLKIFFSMDFLSFSFLEYMGDLAYRRN